MFIIKDGPEKPASALGEQKIPLSFVEEAKLILANKNYRLLMGSFGLLFGSY